MRFVVSGEGGRSSAAGASDKSKSLPSTPAPAPAAPNGLAITAVDSGGSDYDDCGQGPSPTQPVLRSKFPRQSPKASPITSASGVYCLSSRDRVRSSHGKLP